MTRSATATAWDYLEQESPRDNIIDFSAYQSERVMTTQHYVLLPVEAPQAALSTCAPRRRNHRSATAANLVHTTLNLAVIFVTLLFTALLSGMV